MRTTDQLTFKIAQNKEDWQDALKVRKKVFIEEQNVPEEIEIDQYEEISTHFIVYNEQLQPVATARFRSYDETTAKIERVAVLPELRGTGLGRELMLFLEKAAKEAGYTKAKLNAQLHAEPFYKKLGYSQISELFYEANIPHVTMVKDL
ncbi:GNAT family N-acetyltransferase [Microaerobacter geothermalis]|uniref:GNAT family N-acetyltransferase n=1 Tax=Microaerobacter geothermalis TaxID=674972 RepID=UPI001F3BDBB6|nr:GNAT family N-acetyltransferase [Microaerobacter geothermalis]MCF6094052.1 GNAT family N-acetyltransferase [Microaerobacter geothermalis]